MTASPLYIDARRSKVLLSRDTDPFSPFGVACAAIFLTFLPRGGGYVRSTSTSRPRLQPRLIPSKMKSYRNFHPTTSSNYELQIFKFWERIFQILWKLWIFFPPVGCSIWKWRERRILSLVCPDTVDRVRRWRDSGWRLPAFLLVDMLRATNL